jgi:hypothetical protein
VDVAFLDAAPISITRYRPRLLGPLAGPVVGRQFQMFRSLDGGVRLEVVVGLDGHATPTRLATAEHERNATAAADALTMWAFTAGIRNGVPVTTRMSLIVD